MNCKLCGTDLDKDKAFCSLCGHTGCVSDAKVQIKNEDKKSLVKLQL